MQSKTFKKITVSPYNPLWPAWFEKEAVFIKEALGQDCLAIYHVGSTSVPGLIAKSKIDIIAVVREPKKAIPALEQIHYTYKGEWNIPFQYGFTKREDVKVNLHVFEDDHPEIELNLCFRDYLRQNTQARNEYGALKERLLKEKSAMERNQSMFPGYTLGKHDFIQKTLRQTGYNRLRLLRCTHHHELDRAKKFRETYFSMLGESLDLFSSTFHEPSHHHFVLYQGLDIIGYTDLEIHSENQIRLHLLMIEESMRLQGFGSKLLSLIEQWLADKDLPGLTVKATQGVEKFFLKHDYKQVSLKDSLYEKAR